VTAAVRSLEGLRQDHEREAHIPLWEFVAKMELQSLVVATSKDPNAKFTVLLVPPETSEPVMVVKAPSTATAERAVDVEARMLAELADGRLGSLAHTVPRLVGLACFGGRRAAVTTALPGRPMTTAYARRGHTRDARKVATDFRAAGSWLAELQRRTAGDVAPLEMDAGVAARLHERFGGDLEPLLAIHERLRRDRVPRTVVHGDFWCGNILLTEGSVSGVVDWEAATTRGEPARDLARFANMYALYLDLRAQRGRVAGHPGLRAGSWGAGLEYAIDGSGWFPDLYRRFVADGLGRLGADGQSWRDVALSGVAEVAALADHDEFARRHLELFQRLSRREGA